MHDDHVHPHQDNDPPGLGHNAGTRRPIAWQAPHRSAEDPPTAEASEPDLDLVEAAFIEGFHGTSDPTSFLRLAGIPFSGTDAGGRLLHLLRVEQESLTDVGALSPQLGGGAPRYDPLPAKLVSRRRRLRFVYADGGSTVALGFAAAKALAPPG